MHHLWSEDIKRGDKPWAGFAQGFCPSKPGHAVLPARSEGTVPCAGGTGRAQSTAAPGMLQTPTSSAAANPALRHAATRQGLCIFYFFSRLLKYSDKSCRHGAQSGTEEGELGWRKAPAPATGLSPRSEVLTNRTNEAVKHADRRVRGAAVPLAAGGAGGALQGPCSAPEASASWVRGGGCPFFAAFAGKETAQSQIPGAEWFVRTGKLQ